jgi:hypothetical protein
MKVGIDSYCYHRLLGDVYPEQQAPSKNWTMEQFIKRAHELGVDGVSLESCFLPRFDASYRIEYMPGDILTDWRAATMRPPMMIWLKILNMPRLLVLM